MYQLAHQPARFSILFRLLRLIVQAYLYVTNHTLKKKKKKKKSILQIMMMSGDLNGGLGVRIYVHSIHELCLIQPGPTCPHI